jgi:hypothetical protein
MGPMIYPLRWLLLVCALTTMLRADFAKDLAHIHTEASGGRARVQALKAIRASGVTYTDKGNLDFVLWAERPNRLRIEVGGAGRKIVQGWDGEHEPWTTDTKLNRTLIMAGEVAAVFKSEAEFDDPLLAGPDRPISIDYAGEVTDDGRDLLKVVVTHNFSSLSYVYLDPETYLVVRRDAVRRYKAGETVVRTDYSDFRAVDGVLLPHRLVVTQAGKRVRETVINRMEANPVLPPGLFTAPASGNN